MPCSDGFYQDKSRIFPGASRLPESTDDCLLKLPFSYKSVDISNLPASTVTKKTFEPGSDCSFMVGSSGSVGRGFFSEKKNHHVSLDDSFDDDWEALELATNQEDSFPRLIHSLNPKPSGSSTPFNHSTKKLAVRSKSETSLQRSRCQLQQCPKITTGKYDSRSD